MSGELLPRVSVVVPTRDRPRLLQRALRSVLNQTFRSFEILVIDDCSKTDPRVVIDSFGDARIRLLRHNTPRGAAAARNSGINEAQGEYVAFLDDDDEWRPEMLRRQVEALDTAPPMVAGSYTGRSVISDSTKQELQNQLPAAVANPGRELPKTNGIGMTSCMMLRRVCLERVGGFDESLPSRQDRDLWIRVAAHYNLIPLREPLLIYHVHVHGGQISTDLDARERGLEVFERRYLDDSRDMRRAYAADHFRLGVAFCLTGRLDDGRRHLRRAIHLHPLVARGYVYMLTSLFGSRAVQAVVDWRRQYRGTRPSGESLES